MKKIILTKNKSTLVDDNDFEWLDQFKWFCSAYGYACRTSKKKTIYMHREIINPRNKEIDHINGDPLDNRKSNLRLVTHKQNLLNKNIYKTSKTKLKGVHWYAKIKRYQVYISINGSKKYLGVYKYKNEAAEAYNLGALKYHKQYARLNKV